MGALRRAGLFCSSCTHKLFFERKNDYEIFTEVRLVELVRSSGHGAFGLGGAATPAPAAPAAEAPAAEATEAPAAEAPAEATEAPTEAAAEATEAPAAEAPAAEQAQVGHVTKHLGNPFFVKMEEGAVKGAEENGLKLMLAAGQFDGDNDSQVTAIENMMAAGVKGIILTANDSTAIVPTVKKARDAGILVIALDTPLNPKMPATPSSPPTTSRPAN